MAKVLRATFEDLDDLNRISIASKMHWSYPAEWLDAWREELKVDEADLHTQDIFKLEDKAQTIGFCAIVEKEHCYEILHLWIDPPFIGRGFGKLVLAETIRQVVKQDKEILVTADPHAEPFYVSLGFTTFDRVESSVRGRYLPRMRKKVVFTVL